MSDTRYVYSANCAWHGRIADIGMTEPTPPTTVTIGGRQVQIPPTRLPCCPHCGSMLFEMPSEEMWWKGAEKHEQKGHTNYVNFLKWVREQPRCWPDIRSAGVEYAAVTGKEVVWDL